MYEYTELNLDDLEGKSEDQVMRTILGHVFFLFDFNRNVMGLGINLQQIIYDQIKNPSPVNDEPVLKTS